MTKNKGDKTKRLSPEKAWNLFVWKPLSVLPYICLFGIITKLAKSADIIFEQITDPMLHYLASFVMFCTAMIILFIILAICVLIDSIKAFNKKGNTPPPEEKEESCPTK